MSNLYRASSHHRRRAPSPAWGAVRLAFVVVLGAGVFALAVMWFRRDASVATNLGEIAEAGIDAANDKSADAVDVPVNDITLVAVEGEEGSARVVRSHEGGVYALTVVADLPVLDTATTAYEAWYVKPGITDFFSLGELFLREDGQWGLAWEVTDALARNDLAAFNRVIIIREPRDGNIGPSADHVVSGEFE